MPAAVFDKDHAFLPHQDLLTYEEITRLVRVFAGQGTRKIRFTGGEPLIRRELQRLIGMVAAVPGIEDIALTTNGVLLPQHAASLRDAGLRRVTISLDALDETLFQAINGRGISVQKVLDGIAAATDAGFESIKINMVVQRGINESQVLPMAEYFLRHGHTLRFIEYMDVGNTNGWAMDRVVPAQEILLLLRQQFSLTEVPRHHHSDVARRFQQTDGPGEIGLITSVTQPFCGACSRARISSKGELFTCLFAQHGTDLRALIRSGLSDERIEQAIQGVWSRRSDQYSVERTTQEANQAKVEMSYIGG